MLVGPVLTMITCDKIATIPKFVSLATDVECRLPLSEINQQVHAWEEISYYNGVQESKVHTCRRITSILLDIDTHRAHEP